MNMTNIRKIIATTAITVVFCSLWQWLEGLIYGAAEPRIVDDIIVVLMIPFFWCTVSFVIEHLETKKQSRESDVNINVFLNDSPANDPGDVNERN